MKNLILVSSHHCNIFQIFGVMSLSMVLISTTTFVLQTVPEFQENGEYPVVCTLLQVMDLSAMAFFTFEYFIRLLCCPKKIAFLTRYSMYRNSHIVLHFDLHFFKLNIRPFTQKTAKIPMNERLSFFLEHRKIRLIFIHFCYSTLKQRKCYTAIRLFL